MPRAAAKPARRSVRRIRGGGDYKVGSMVRAAKPRRLKGHGDYSYDNPGPWGKAGKWIGSALGSAYAGQGGGKIGEKLGSYLHYIGKLFGSGDYVTSSQVVRANTLVNSSQVPQFVNSAHTMRVQHREYLCDIFSGTSGAFQVQDFPINPGMLQTFPWLSDVVGSNYQQYRINGMVFEFRSMSADALNSTNTALGSVVMATDYDSADLRFTSKAQMENTEFGVSCKPSSCMIHAVECAPRQKTLSEQYVRFAAPPSNTDIRMYDLGRFSIATVGMQADNVNLGELWVSYDIEFLKPIQLPPGIDQEYAYYLLSYTTATLASNPCTLNADTSSNQDNIGLSIEGSTITFPATMRPGTVFMIQYYVHGASTASVVAPVVTSTHHLVSITYRNVPTAATTSTSVQTVAYFKYDGLAGPSDPPILAIGSFTPPGTIDAAEIVIMQVNPQILG